VMFKAKVTLPGYKKHIFKGSLEGLKIKSRMFSNQTCNYRN
jgi:hypothetical protein